MNNEFLNSISVWQDLVKSIDKYLMNQTYIKALNTLCIGEGQTFHIPSNEHGNGHYKLTGYAPEFGFMFNYTESRIYKDITTKVTFPITNVMNTGMSGGSRIYNGKLVPRWSKKLNDADLVGQFKSTDNQEHKEFLFSLICFKLLLRVMISTEFNYQYNTSLYKSDRVLFESKWEHIQVDLINDFNNWKETGKSNWIEIKSNPDMKKTQVGYSNFGRDAFELIDELMSLDTDITQDELEHFIRRLFKRNEFKYMFDIYKLELEQK